MDTNVALHQPVALARDPGHLRIMVVSEVRFLRESLAKILEGDPWVSVVGVCADLAEAVMLHPTLQPDIVLLDAGFPDAAATVARDRRAAPDVRVVVFAVTESETDIVAWAEAGVIGYIPSAAALADLMRLVRDIHDGEQLCSGRIAAALFRRLAVTARPGNGCNTASSAPALTARERQAAELVRTGASDKEIARRLNISLATTKTHVHSLLGKLSVQRRGQVAVRLHEYEQHPG